MPTIIIPIKHKIGQAEALKRIRNYISTINNVLPPQVSNLKIAWNAYESDFSFSFSGMSIKGNVFINNDTIHIKSKIPIAFYPLKNQIEKIVRQHAENILL